MLVFVKPGRVGLKSKKRRPPLGVSIQSGSKLRVMVPPGSKVQALSTGPVQITSSSPYKNLRPALASRVPTIFLTRGWMPPELSYHPRSARVGEAGGEVGGLALCAYYFKIVRIHSGRVVDATVY